MEAPAATYTEGQLNKFRRLVRVAARYLFAGDLSERLQEMDAQNADADVAAAMPPKRKRKKVRTWPHTQPMQGQELRCTGWSACV